MPSITSVQYESQHQRFSDISRDSQHYQLAHIAQTTSIKATRSRLFLLTKLCQGLKIKIISHSHPDVPLPKLKLP